MFENSSTKILLKISKIGIAKSTEAGMIVDSDRELQQDEETMKKQDVRVGATYTMKHTSGMITVQVTREASWQSYPNGRARNHTYWEAVNLETKRTIRIKSATRLIREEQTR